MSAQQPIFVRTGIKIVAALVVFLVVSAGAFSATHKVSPVGWGWFGPVNEEDGVALGGYDPVTYHQGDAKVGAAELVQRYRGAQWRFESESNRALFESAPEKYAPEFGGFCAFAVSKGFTADIDPTAWHVHSGKLYVFADQDVKRDWVAELEQGMLAAAETNWSRRPGE